MTQLPSQVLGRHTDRVLRSANAVIRGAALILIVVAMFTGLMAHGPTRLAQMVCLIVGTAAVVLWGVDAWRRPEDRPALDDGWLVLLFAIMAAASVACTSAHGGALISFALLAALGAGVSCGLVGGVAVGGVGVLAITVGAVVASAAAVPTLGSCLGVIVALLMGRGRRNYRVQAEQAALLLAQADLLRAEQSQVATLSERTRIAREIHDVLAHSLGALGIQIQAARALLSEQHDSAQALVVLNQAQRIATEGLDETRRAVHALRSDSRPLADELAALAVTHQTLHDVAVNLQINGPVHPLPPDAALALLRTAQESLVNAAKHSPRQPVTVELTYDETRARLCVSNPLGNPGPGSGREQAIETIDGGYGLIGLRERLLLIHGSLTASPRAGQWEVTAQVPR